MLNHGGGRERDITFTESFSPIVRRDQSVEREKCVLANVGSRVSSRAARHGRHDGRKGFWDVVIGRPGKRGFAKANEGFSAEGVTGIMVAIQTNG